MLTKGYSSLVDDEDYVELIKHEWCYDGIGYARRNAHNYTTGKPIPVRIHQQVMGFPKSNIDHINGDRLDNRKSNLRLCTQVENLRNSTKKSLKCSSRYKGVSFSKEKRKWHSYITIDSTRKTNKRKHLGYFNNEIDAAKAYNQAARQIFGKFGRLNKL